MDRARRSSRVTSSTSPSLTNSSASLRACGVEHARGVVGGGGNSGSVGVNGGSSNNSNDMFDSITTTLLDDEVFFDSPSTGGGVNEGGNGPSAAGITSSIRSNNSNNIIDQTRQIYMGERVHGWRTRSTEPQHANTPNNVGQHLNNQRLGYRGTRISAQLLDGVLDNSRRPLKRGIKLLRSNELDERYDHRPYFTYWINTVQILVLVVSLICYGVGPIGIGMEQKTGQVLVTSLSLQQVQHLEPRNVWIGPRGDDLVHLGAKFSACMRRDIKILDVIAKTKRQERETACCIRNDDSGCVQSSQADCTIRGLWHTVSVFFLCLLVVEYIFTYIFYAKKSFLGVN